MTVSGSLVQVNGARRSFHVRFSYDVIRDDTARCVEQLQAVLARDSALAPLLHPTPHVETPQMDPDPLWALTASPRAAAGADPDADPGYFADVRTAVDVRTLRECQKQAFAALGNYYGSGGTKAACVMSVGAGKTVLGVVATLALTRRRALVVTPGNVIRGTFDRAFDHQAPGNALYGLPGGPLIPGRRPPSVQVIDRDRGGVRGPPASRSPTSTTASRPTRCRSCRSVDRHATICPA